MNIYGIEKYTVENNPARTRIRQTKIWWVQQRENSAMHYALYILVRICCAELLATATYHKSDGFYI